MSVLPRFALHRPATLDEALDVVSFDDMPLGGGTELLLAMRMRLLRPSSLVNLKGLTELKGISTANGSIVVGGGVTHDEARHHPEVQKHLPILGRILAHVGNPRVRASGTLAGNLVFAEPKSDVITLLTALDASIELVSTHRTRVVAVADFIIGPYHADREPDEVLTRIMIPYEPVLASAYVKFQTMERPTVAVAAVDLQTEEAQVRRVVIGAVGGLPLIHTTAIDAPIDASELASRIEPTSDIAGSADYKRHVARVMVERALRELEEGR